MPKKFYTFLSAFYFNDNAQPAGTGKDYRQINCQRFATRNVRNLFSVNVQVGKNFSAWRVWE